MGKSLRKELQERTQLAIREREKLDRRVEELKAAQPEIELSNSVAGVIIELKTITQAAAERGQNSATVLRLSVGSHGWGNDPMLLNQGEFESLALRHLWEAIKARGLTPHYHLEEGHGNTPGSYYKDHCIDASWEN